MKKILLVTSIILSIFLPVSCHKEGKVMALSSPEGAYIWMEKGKGIVKVEATPQGLNMLGEISGMDPIDALREIFGEGTYSTIDSEVWKKREGMLRLLRDQSGAKSTLEAAVLYEKDVRDTEFMELLDGLTASFDEKALFSMLRGTAKCAEYSLEAVLSKSSSWSETRAFASEWASQLLQNI